MGQDAAELAFCEGKKRFEAPGLAARAAKRKRGRRIYRCRSCQGWHVGSVDYLSRERKHSAR